VKSKAKRIRERLPSLLDEMRIGVVDVSSFPIALFTRPLAKIEHIVDPGLVGEDPLRTTQRAQHAKVDTLAFYLKEMRVADAMEAMRKLAQEVGIGERSSQDLPIEQIDGEILKGYRDLRKRYAEARAALVDINGRVDAIEKALRDAPGDFQLPSNLTLDQLVGRPSLIEGQLDQSLKEDVDELLDSHDEEMTLGMFAPLMREARTRLLEVPEQAIRGLEGRVRTAENAILSYRQRLLEDQEMMDVRRALNVLQRARGKSESPLPRPEELELRSLRQGVEFITESTREFVRTGNALLAGTDVDFEGWRLVVEAVRTQKEPALPAARLDALVEHGLLRRVYAIPGSTP
jgi:hypothetical protein